MGHDPYMTGVYPITIQWSSHPSRMAMGCSIALLDDHRGSLSLKASCNIPYNSIGITREPIGSIPCNVPLAHLDYALRWPSHPVGKRLVRGL